MKEWEIGCLYGPHGAPDFFTYKSIETFFASTYQVHYNSNRLGIRLNGPKPEWTRSDGGEAGLHPSNVHDCEYAIGSVNFTGDLPVILTRDGPSLGGFVCPVTIAKGELWKVGQVKPGDSIRFVPMTFEDALALEKAQDKAIAALEPLAALPPSKAPELKAGKTVSSAVLAELPAKGSRPTVAYRQAGDKYILLEYGPMALDLRFRFRVHALMEELRNNPVAGILELSPGVRSLQINYDSRVIAQGKLIDALLKAEEVLPPVDTMKVDTRVVHLPMAFEDSATLDAVAKYRQSVRDTAPWLPNNVDFIQRLNGLSSRDEVRDIVFKTSYMVLGLGDVYLGAPCAVPVDPRHRLLTSKYNPARTFTAEGTVGIGGVYMCIYGMDSPGGYQLIGRTLPIWNKFLLNKTFENGEPWLLKFFDQVRFYPVSEAELTEHRQAFREGRATIKIEHEVFDLAAHEQFLTDNAASIAAFKEQQQAAFNREVAVWQAAEANAATAAALAEPEKEIGEIDGQLIASDISGNIWKLLVEVGQSVEVGARRDRRGHEDGVSSLGTRCRQGFRDLLQARKTGRAGRSSARDQGGVTHEGTEGERQWKSSSQSSVRIFREWHSITSSPAGRAPRPRDQDTTGVPAVCARGRAAETAGLLRVAPGEGFEIVAEVWSLAPEAFGTFVAGVPSPLGIGTTRLADGTTPKGFIVEAEGIRGAEDISRFGGWRAYVTSLR